MKLELSRTADYAIRAVLAVAAGADHEVVGTAEVVRQSGIPAAYAPQVLSRLVRGEVLAARPGPGGGYLLRRNLHAISLLDVVKAAEGSLEATRCVLRNSACNPARPCSIHATMTEARQSMTNVLASTTLEQLVHHS